MMIPETALGAVIFLAPVTLYPSYVVATTAVGADPLVDQQLAGALLAIGGGAAGAAEQDHIVRLVREAGPDLGAGHAVEIAVADCLGPGRGQV